MTERAAAFVQAWVERELDAVPYIGEEASGLVAAELAARCLREASQGGITRAEIEQAIGDLRTYMISKINVAAGKEVGRMAAEDNE